MASQTAFVQTAVSTGTGDVAWANPTNAQGDTDNAATCDPGFNGGVSEFLRGTNLGFSVPTDATITGIELEFERVASANNRMTDNSVRIIKGGAVAGAERSAGDSWTTTVGFSAVGGEADLWDTEWSPADVNASDFGGQIQVIRVHNNAVTGSIRRVRLTVFYDEAGGAQQKELVPATEADAAQALSIAFPPPDAVVDGDLVTLTFAEALDETAEAPPRTF